MEKVSPRVKIGKNVRIEENCSIGFCEIKDDVFVGRGTIIEDGSIVASQVYLSPGCILGKNTRIGKEARLGHGVIVEANAQVKPKANVPSGFVITREKK